VIARRAAALAAAGALALASAAEAQQGGSGATRQRTAYEDLQMFSQVLNQIRVNHPDSVDTHRLFMAAVQGMVQAADPHSYVVPRARLSPDREQALRQGRLHPVPVEFRYVRGTPVVVAVAPGTAAARQDILRGDVLVSVDGAPVLAESATELDVFLAGQRGSSVRLGLERERSDGSRTTLERIVRRERGDEETPVPVAILLDGGTGYVRVTTFSSERAADDLAAALRRLEQGGMQRLLLDLRDNGGGLVAEATKVAGNFLPAGATVYTARGRKPEVNDSVVVRRSFWRRERQYPIVVLVNEGTASASELVAGALQDHDRALVVGRPTFGKALVMQGFPLSDGSMVMLTIGHLRTPCGRVVQRQYRDVRAADYYRMSRAERDTVGRESCRTVGGRTVYGGGGIYPDVLLPEEEGEPVWLARLAEEGVHTRWIGGYLTDHAAAFPSADALAASPRLPEDALAAFRGFARQAGHPVPEGADADRRLERMLLPEIAGTRWGSAGYYRVLVALDDRIRRAVDEFARYDGILGGP
jgi:carboxyl-terminal processing protease